MENNDERANNPINSNTDENLNTTNIPNNFNLNTLNNLNQINNNLFINNNFANQLNPILNNILNNNSNHTNNQNNNNLENNAEEGNDNNNINNNNNNNNILESAQNSINILNRITAELTTIQSRLQNYHNEINNINHVNNNIENLRELPIPNYQLNRNFNLNRRVVNINLLNSYLSDYAFKDHFFLFSSGLALMIICWIILLNLNQEITFTYLENEDMYLNYLLINIVIFIFSWNFYLILQNFIFQSSPVNKEENKNSIKLKELLLFSPFWMYCVIKYSVPNYLATVFDGFFIVFVSIQYKINFIFSLRLYKFINNKITNISNIHLNENKKLIRNMRIHFAIIILYNLIFLSILFLFLGESDFLYIFIMLNKVFFIA